jgi:DNA-binding winged helix-turn-helix (wHTH) protein/Tol biopolymer transport system component
MRLKTRHRYEFGPFTADPEVRTLMRDGEVVPLPPKVFEVLLALLRSGGAPISRDDLLKAVWGDTFVEEGNLTNAVSILRKVLRHNSGESQYIVTIPRRGYRFAAPIREGQSPSALEIEVGEFSAEKLDIERVEEQTETEHAGAVSPSAVLKPLNVKGSHRLTRPVRWAATAVVAVVLAAGSVLLLLRLPRPAAPAHIEYTQLTNFADSATSPALSPDGHMLAFIRSEYTFGGPGQIYVKLLPDGEPVQLTFDDLDKRGSPKFSPDGTRIAYAAFQRGVPWNTWVVPALGGQPRLLLANASGLTWIEAGPRQSRLLFSELTGRSDQMAIVSATESRAEYRTVYMPSETGMAHRSYLSPDGKQVLLAEMAHSAWLPCRLTPFDGSASGKPAGPAPAQCADAAWSPDGKWMYFSANTGNGYHIWRQRFPDGVPEQITSGVTQEEGIEVAPDGRSFVTSIGVSQSTVWFHDSGGDRQITSEGYGLLPSVSPDGKKLYYLLRAGGERHFVSGELWAADLESGQRQRLLPDFVIQHYAISADGQRVVFVVSDDTGRSPVWVAALNGRSSPRPITTNPGRKAYFSAGGYVVFTGEEKGTSFVYRVKEDGSELQKVVSIRNTVSSPSVSPDGRWLVIQPASDSTDIMDRSAMLYPVGGGPPRLLCAPCTNGNDVERTQPPGVSWSPDGKFLYMKFQASTYAVPLRPGEMLPPMPPDGFRSKEDVAALPGARLIPEQGAFPGPNPNIYAFTKVATHRNIYRVSVP